MPLGNLFKKRSEDLEPLRDITDDVIESDFIPYACHLDPFTLLTKNGELLQTIKVTGFTYENIGNHQLDLRTTIRKAVLASVKNDSYALWFHTIRRKTSFSLPGHYDNAFSEALHAAWQQKNGWDTQFVNELYITVVKEGQSTGIVNPKDFVRSLLPSRDDAHRMRFLDNACKELNGVVNNMLEVLSAFGATKLGVTARDGVYYSEPLEFLNKIANLTDDVMPLPDNDLSDYLTTHEVTFGYNAMEVRSHQGKRRFAAILTIKEYKELALSAIDQVLQLPIEFIVTQCIDFINHDKALKGFREQKKFMLISKERELSRISGLDDILDSDKGRATDYGAQQLNVYLLADNLKELEKYVQQAVRSLAMLGIIAIREDLKFEECYWAQLPANFEFLKRLKPINTSRIGGFANLNNFPAGKVTGNHWGQAVTVFYTAARTPYFFNFHVDDNGHTSIVGPQGSGKNVLLHFLLSEARKYQPRLVIFDSNHSSEPFIATLGGTCHRIAADAASRTLVGNPLRMADLPRNRKFLSVWLAALMGKADSTLADSDRQALEAAVAHLFTLPEQERSLAVLLTHLRSTAPDVAAAFGPWEVKGNLSGWFDGDVTGTAAQHSITNIDLSAMMNTPALLLPVFMYLLHEVTSSLDGRPTIIVFKEAWKLFDNAVFGPRIAGLLDMLRKNNAMCILTTEDAEHAGEHGLSVSLMRMMASQIYLPNEDPSDDYTEVFGLSEDEISHVTSMQKDERHFLLKRGTDAIVAELNLEGLDDFMPVLSGVASDASPLPAAPQEGIW